MSHNRRDFLRRGMLAVPAATLFPGIMARSVMASPGGSARNLVLIELEGGNDGFNTLVPFGVNSGTYYSEFRPTLNIPEASLLKLDGEVGFNPSFSHIKSHFDAGRLSIVQGVTYPDPSFSHEVAERFWAKATEDPSAQGWLSRLLALDPVPSFPCALDLRSSLSPIYHFADRFIPAFTSLNGFQFPYDGHHWSDKDNRRAAFEAAVAQTQASGDVVDQEIAGTADGLLNLIDTVASLPEYEHVGDYPDGWFSSRLRVIATLMNGNLGLNVFHIGLGGWDTHSEQELNNYHSDRLAQVSQAVNALYDDVVNMGKQNDTLFVIYSEFGRTVYENGSAGTDHGSVNPVFVLGDPVVGGIVNSHPSMDPADLTNDDDPPMSVDLRDVLGTVIDKWFSTAASPILLGYTHSDLGFLG